MKNKSIVIIVVLMFGLALGAGVVAGKLSSRLPAGEAPAAARGTLSDALQLNADQQARMQDIWEDVRKKSRAYTAEAQQVQTDQTNSLMEMLNEEQRKKYSEMAQVTVGKIAILDAKRRDAFRKAVRDTYPILNESQRKTYEQIIKDRVGDLGDDGWSDLKQ